MGLQHLARQSERQLDQHGDGDSLFFEDRWYTRGWMADQAARFGAGLTGLGVRPGDRVVVLMANCPEVLVTYNAAWRAGAVVTPLIFLVSACRSSSSLTRKISGTRRPIPARWPW